MVPSITWCLVLFLAVPVVVSVRARVSRDGGELGGKSDGRGTRGRQDLLRRIHRLLSTRRNEEAGPPFRQSRVLSLSVFFSSLVTLFHQRPQRINFKEIYEIKQNGSSVYVLLRRKGASIARIHSLVGSWSSIFLFSRVILIRQE